MLSQDSYYFDHSKNLHAMGALILTIPILCFNLMAKHLELLADKYRLTDMPEYDFVTHIANQKP